MRTAAAPEDIRGANKTSLILTRQALAAWQDPPVRVIEQKSQAIEPEANSNTAMARISPGAMLQFAIAGLLVSASMIVAERKTAVCSACSPHRPAGCKSGRPLPGNLHQILCQFIILIVFGQLLLRVNLSARPGCDPVGGYQRRSLHRCPGAANRRGGAQRRTSDHLLAGAYVLVDRFGRRVVAAGGG